MLTRIATIALLGIGIATPAYAPAATPMPEPGLLGLVALGIAGAILIARR